MKRKREFIEQLGGKCISCGYAKNLAAFNFHHVNNKELSLSLRTMGQRSLDLLENEIEKCQLLCANCHLQHHHPALTIANLQVDIEPLVDLRTKLQSTGSCLTCGEELVGQKRYFCSNRCKSKHHNVYHQNYENQQRRGITRKLELITRLGGQCAICGYKDNLAALVFHHLDRDVKDYELDLRSLANRSLDSLLAEFEKCQLLCANCHAEVHNPEMTLENIASK